jgi:hypothetical protein
MCFNIFYVVLCVQKGILIRVFLKSLVILLTSLPQYVKVAHFFVVLGAVGMFCFFGCGGGFSISFLMYLLFWSTC